MRDDIDGGFDPELDEFTAVAPPDPTYREGAVMFVWDDAGAFALPRVMLEGVGRDWSETRGVMFNLQQPGGRTLIHRGSAAPLGVHDANGRARVFGGGPLRFECVEPFRHWRMEFDGPVAETDDAAMLAGEMPGPEALTVPVRVEVDAHMAAPPWLFSAREGEGTFPLPGERRFEQLFTATGVVHLDGGTQPFRGGGLRIHRVGGNRGRTDDYFGHCWQTALFPSGRAFGFIHYHPRPDGSQKWREGWVTDGGAIEPAWGEETPWMAELRTSGEDVSFTLRTGRGPVHVEAETTMSWILPGSSDTFPTLQTGVTRCVWDGEVGYGMIERAVAPGG